MENLDLVIIPAARQGETEVLKELIRRGANVNFRDEKGYTPLIIACL
jgi:ankyrin repeat protein